MGGALVWQIFDVLKLVLALFRVVESATDCSIHLRALLPSWRADLLGKSVNQADI